MTILEDFAEYLSGPKLTAASDRDRETLAQHVADTVLATRVGATLPDGQAVLEMQAGGTSMRPSPINDNPLDDVAVRCAITRMTEIDDIHLPSGVTPGSIIIPTAITMARHLGVTQSSRFARAVISGLEAMTRLAAAVDGQNIVYRGIWPTYLAAPFGTAATTAQLLDLNVEDTAHALAIALTSLAGRMGQPGSDKTSRWFLAGMAARNGCVAALSAANGFRGDLGLIDRDWLFTAHGLATESAKFTQGFEGPSAISQMSVKPYCSAKQVLAAIAALQEILARDIEVDDIEKVEVSVPENYFRMIDHGVVDGNRLSSVTSAPYQLALAAHHPAGLYDAARDRFHLTAPIVAFMDKVSVSIDAGLAQHLPANWPARVAVQTANRKEVATVIDAPGDPRNSFDLGQIRDKFHAFGDALMGADVAEIWIDTAIASITEDQALADLSERFASICC